MQLEQYALSLPTTAEYYHKSLLNKEMPQQMSTLGILRNSTIVLWSYIQINGHDINTYLSLSRQLIVPFYIHIVYQYRSSTTVPFCLFLQVYSGNVTEIYWVRKMQVDRAATSWKVQLCIICDAAVSWKSSFAKWQLSILVNVAVS